MTFKTDARNEQSRRAIARLGATFEGVLRAHKFASDGTIRDTACFSILRERMAGGAGTAHHTGGDRGHGRDRR